MIRPLAKRITLLVISFAVLGFLTACAGRRITTSVEDQTFVPGPPPQAAAPAIEEAKVAPPERVLAEVPKIEPQAPAPMEAPKVERPAPPPVEPSKVEVPPPAAPVEEARVTEPPIAPPPAVRPPPVQPPSAPAPVRTAPPPPSGEVVSLSDVYFDFDQFLFRSDARAALEVNARLLKADSKGKILIEGHCDERGTLAYNLVLGERRARAVKQYLQDLGVPASQIQITSYGKERPFCTEHSEACWQSNRRAHFRRQ